MDLEINILRAASQRKINIMLLLIFGVKGKMIQMNSFTKQKQIHRHRKQTYGYWAGREGEG